MIQTLVFTLLCYFVVCFTLLIMVLEYLPGTGKTSHLLHKNQLYYRVGETCRWICTKNRFRFNTVLMSIGINTN